MQTIGHAKRMLLFPLLISAAHLLSACDQGAEPPDAAVKEAGQEHVDAMTREHADDTTAASEAVAAAPAKPVHGEMMPYAEVDGQLAHGYLAMPEDVAEPLPAVIMIHEWWGLNDNIKRAADQLAGEGYIVLAVDLYGGNVAATPEQAREYMMNVIENPESGHENIRQAYSFLKSTALAPPKIGAIGWCFGGGWSLTTAMLFPEDIAATVIYYGQTTDNEDRLRAIQGAILGHFGAEDSSIPLESVKNFEMALGRLGKDYEITIYPGAGHGFANPTGQNYEPTAATQSWSKTLEFLNAKLKN
ncbi:MAG TPA: dienelactone hydrolase family protein [Woeseiaceae bacterium]